MSSFYFLFLLFKVKCFFFIFLSKIIHLHLFTFCNFSIKWFFLHIYIGFNFFFHDLVNILV